MISALGDDEATSIEDLGHTEGDGVVRVAATLVDVQKDVVLLQQLRILCLGPDVITPVQAVVAKQVRRYQVPNAPVASHVTGPRVRAEEEKRRWL